MNVRPILISLASLGASISGFAQTWDGGASTSAWGTGNNWNPNSVPGTNVVVNFDGASANGQLTIDLGADRTVLGLNFISAVGTNPFSFNSGDRFYVGTSGIVNNDADTQVFDADFTLGSSQTWNAASGGFTVGGDINLGSFTLTYTGSGNSTIDGRITGSGGEMVKNGSGVLTLTKDNNSFTGDVTVNAGTLRVSAAGDINISGVGNNSHLGRGSVTVNSGAVLEFAPGDDFLGISRDLTINGGLVRIIPADRIQGLMEGSGLLTFGSTGGTLEIASPLQNGVPLGSVQVDAATGTPAIIQYGFIANTSSPFGWDTSERELIVENGNLTGTGRLKLELTAGAMTLYEQSAFGGSLVFSGVSGGDASAGSASTLVGRLMFNSGTTFSVTNGLFFENSMQVTATGARTIDANITVNSGEVAFQGRSRSSGALQDLTIGATVGGKTLTIKDGATATMDVRFRDENSLNVVGGVVLNANTAVEAGGALKFTKSVAVGGETVDEISVNGDITGQGTTDKESLITLEIGSGTGGVSFATSSDLIINGSGLGGLRVEGTQTQVDNLLTTERFQDLTGTGGTLTIAYNNNGTRTFSDAPSAGTAVRLGFDAVGAAAPMYNLGSSADDLQNWGGLVVKGGTVRQMTDQSFVGSGAATTLDLTGGALILHDGSADRTMTFEGGANLTGGNLNNGTLVLGSGVVFGASITFSNAPNITINNSGSATISGTSVSGLGTVTKQGAGTLTVQSEVSASLIDIQAGTLLLGSDNRLGDSTNLRLSGGTFGSGGNDETIGTLTLTADSTINFGSGSSILNFADSSGAAWTGGTKLYITNWSGEWFGGGADQLFFGSAQSHLSAGQEAQVWFVNPNGLDKIVPGRMLASGEIVPVPEPATIGLGALLLGSLGYRERERLARWASRWRSAMRKLAAA